MSLHDIATAANELAALLEASVAKGLKHPRHSRHVAPARKRIKAVMAHYFDRQRKAVLAEVNPRIRRQLMLHPSDSQSRLFEAFMAERAGKPLTVKGIIAAYEASTQSKTFARSLVPTSLHPLTFAATGSETSEYNEAITELISAAAKSLGSTAGEDLASTYLRENSLSKLTGNLAATTTERLQNALATAWDEGGSYGQMVAAIQDTFEDFSDTRAGLIAQTEVNDAYSDARQSTAEALGYDEKRWDPDGNACPECQANADQDWIDIGETFESGDDAPTAHPGCDCGCDYRKSSDEEG